MISLIIESGGSSRTWGRIHKQENTGFRRKYIMKSLLREDKHKKKIFSSRTPKGVGRVNPPDR